MTAVDASGRLRSGELAACFAPRDAVTDELTADSLRPGSRVGPWCVEGYGGRGSYGAVYRARRVGWPGSAPVALKLALFPYEPRFPREVELLSRFRHPSIPQLVDWGWWHSAAGVSHPYLVTEWVRGLPLYVWARMHGPGSFEVLRVVAQVAWALDVLHGAACLHRDVKGDNILVEPEGRALLVDYGSGTWAGAPSLTESLMPPNTREYRSPEALRWEHQGQAGARYEARPADDIYALGVTAYRLVTGEYPGLRTEAEAGRDPLREAPHRWLPQALNERVKPELAALIERMLAAAPEARGQARELAEAAEAAAEHVGPEARVPLAGVERVAAESGVMPVQSPLESGSEHPAGESVPGPVPPRAQPREPAWDPRPGWAAAAAVLLCVASAWSLGHCEYLQAPEVTRAETPESAMKPDAGTAGLGEDMLTARMGPQEVLASEEAISLEMPDEPLPGQVRAPCKRRRVIEINGGCWGLAKEEPPCSDASYEWRGACYFPVLDRTRVPTTKKPQ